jgi:hypothetical protein
MMINYTNKEYVEYIRLALLSNIFSIEEAHQKLYSLIELDVNPHNMLIDAAMSNEKDTILSCLELVGGKYDCVVVECLMASDVLERYHNKKLSLHKIAFALYLQLIDEKTSCWQKDINKIMKLDDGFRLVTQGVGDKRELSKEITFFLLAKQKYCLGNSSK